ncbi:hypothetical protein K504DRAFT_418496 [Pleomassaria siparia CBS 279.74]|uniref:UBA domain-containing protein n=1 Tax=Pleomassaria siparia CBS 279.74 TaxID=1314801 RepID=A0A6G1JS79_9PLEO|nr:hypothetical protein K504DRAFT_418496 [Pleomassaria siparia CBS 279.74]
MDDLSGLDWSAPSKPASNPPAVFPPFRQTPTPQLSGRSTPLSAQQSGVGAISSGNRTFKPPSKPATPANDSFAGLVSLNTSKPSTNNLTLQERQRQLQEEKLRQETERKKQYETQFGAPESKFWDTLGSGKNTPEPTASGLHRPAVNVSGGQTLSRTINKPFAGLDTSSKRPIQSSPPEDDLLAAFNSAAPVDSSSHFPPSSSFNSGRSTPALGTFNSRGHTPAPQTSTNNVFHEDDDDDMFGLGQLAKKPAPAASISVENDDILGLLGKPVTEFQKKTERSPSVERRHATPQRPPSPESASPEDKAVAELVDMGFPANRSAIALATTESGTDVQAAVSWLLNQAHLEAKQKTEARSRDRSHQDSDHDERPRQSKSRTTTTTRDSSAGEPVPAWMRKEEGRSRSGQRKQDTQHGAQEKDVSQYATEIGTNLFKSANSLWKTGQKKVQRAVADFQQDADPNVPKWMKTGPGLDNEEREAPGKPRRAAPSRAVPSVTDEAMMLEAGSRPTKPSRASESRHNAEPLPARQRRGPDEAFDGYPNRMSSQSPSLRQPLPAQEKRPNSRLTRQDVEEQASQAYTSSSRRRKATPQPDLFSSEPPTASHQSSRQPTPAQNASRQPTPAQNTSRQPTPAQSNNPFLNTVSAPKARSPAVSPPTPKPRAPPRQIPPASSSALNSSASYRQKGSEAFKRGDYSAAHIAYCSALGPLPDTHPVTIVVLCNRAVTNIKVGDPKAAVSDADAALAIIGVSKGEGEKILLGGTEGSKDMREFYGKALMRKAEALEHMEKWTDASKVWKEAVEANVGGSISIQGRNRCEKAAGGGNSTTPAVKRPPVRKAPPPKPSALSDLGGGPAAESEAVKKLKAANIAADNLDDEKFRLTDQVDATLVAWKGSKSDNLRALLGSLDKVLWPEAGWNKVNMGDLVMPNKVKIVYMKAIAKVHPDKISQTATTEQRMISAAVFATLNEAWDKFKKDNGM